MAVYFDHRIEAPDSSDVPFQLTWHSSLPILAVASSSPATGGKVDLYLQQVTSDIKVCNISLILTHTNIVTPIWFMFRGSMWRTAM